MIKEKKLWYKRWWAIVLYVFIGLIFLGNLIPDNNSTTEKSQEVVTEPTANTESATEKTIATTKEPVKKTEFKVGDEFIVGNFKWKITGFERKSEIGEYIMDMFMGKKADGEFLIVNVEVENVGKSAEYLMDSFVKLVDDQDREFSPSSGAAIYLKPQGSALMFETINPGIVKKGKIVYDVPVGLKVANVRISSSLVSNSFYTVKLIT
jgi:hypothetical protein